MNSTLLFIVPYGRAVQDDYEETERLVQILRVWYKWLMTQVSARRPILQSTRFLHDKNSSSSQNDHDGLYKTPFNQFFFFTQQN